MRIEKFWQQGNNCVLLSQRKLCGEFSFVSFLSVVARGSEAQGRSKPSKPLRSGRFSAKRREMRAKCFGRMVANVKTGHWHKLFNQIVVDALQNKTKIRSKNSSKEMHMNLKIQNHSEGTHNRKFSHVQSWNVLFHPRRCMQDFLKVQTEKNHVVFDKHDRGAFVPFLLQN